MSAPLIAKDHLRNYVDRIERLNEERKALSDDVSDIYKEAKANGFDAKALKIVVGRRAKGTDAVAELDSIVEVYEAALGTSVALRAGAREPKARAGDVAKPTPPDELAGSSAVEPSTVNRVVGGSSPPRSANTSAAEPEEIPGFLRRQKAQALATA